MPSNKLQQSIDLLKKKIDQEAQDADWGLFHAFTDFMFQFIVSEKSEEQRKDFILKFRELSEYKEQIEFIVNDDTSQKLIKSIVEEFLVNREENCKNTRKARELREAGNSHFRAKKYKEALQYYSDAIAFAPFISVTGEEADSNELSLSLANRSAALFSMKRFQESLQDIDRSVTFGYLPNRCHLLFSRKIHALKALQKDSEANAVIDEMTEFAKNKVTENTLKDMQAFVRHSSQQKISVAKDFDRKRLQTEIESRNKCLANASDCVRLNYTPEKGRHILAARDISASEVLISELPFAAWLKPSLYGEFCAHCMKNLNLFHFPCRKCSVARYCDEKCEAEAWDKYHSLECEHIDIFYTLSSGQLALRILLTAGIDECIKEAKQAKKDDCSVYKADYSSVLSLVDHCDRRSTESLCSFAVGATFLAFLCEKMSIFTDLNQFYFFGGLLLKHILQIQCNTCSITYDDSQRFIGHQTLSSQHTVIGTAIYPTIALLNHSCDNCVYPLFDGSRVTIKSTDFIRAGNEVTFNYGFHFQKMSFKDRHEALKSQYLFDCCCKMCAKKVENIGQAFRCNSCDGALIMNKDDSNYCVECNKSDNNVGVLKAKFTSSCLLTSKAFECFNENNEQAEPLLLNCIENLKDVVHQKHELLAEIHEKLAKSYEQQKNFINAAKHWYSLYKIVTEILGEETYDALNCLLSISMCLIEEVKDSNNAKKMYENAVKARKYFSRAVKISDKLKGKEYKVLISIDAASRSIELMPILSSYFSLV